MKQNIKSSVRPKTRLSDRIRAVGPLILAIAGVLGLALSQTGIGR
ncbi:hypothetical protein [Curtobacterium sp. MCBD17_028]|nr:hypothetical protein [Curtobacterium sp. MCBD17_028]